MEEIPDFTTGYWAMATNIHDRAAGFIQDAAPINGVTTIEHYVVTQSFTAFTPQVVMQFGSESNDDAGKLTGAFQLGANSNGVDPLHERVDVKIGAFSITLPAGVLAPDGAGGFRFEGVLDTVQLKASLRPAATPPAYTFTIEVVGANFDGILAPLSVRLALGDDTGQTQLTTGTAEFGARAPVPCDVNGDGQVDRTDVNAVFLARDTTAPPAAPVFDPDGDGRITIRNARACGLRCTYSNCAP